MRGTCIHTWSWLARTYPYFCLTTTTTTTKTGLFGLNTKNSSHISDECACTYIVCK